MPSDQPTTPPRSRRAIPERWRRPVAFVAVGGASAAVDMGLFLLLTRFGLEPWAASAVSFLAAFAVNYRGNRDLVFRAGAVSGALRRYVVLVAFNWVASTMLVGMLAATALPGWFAKAVSMVVVAAFNYVALRRWVFQARSGGDRTASGADEALTGADRRNWAVFWSVLGLVFLAMATAVFLTRVWQTPDGMYYYARALRLTGLSEVDAYAEIARVGDPLGYRYAVFDMMFHYDLVLPRVVGPALAAPFVALFGHVGMLVPTVAGTAVFFGGTAWFLALRYGRGVALAVTVLAMTCVTWFFFSIVTQPEGLAALWFAGALLAAVCHRRSRAARRWPWLALAAGLTVLFAFTRQAQLIPAGALFMAWLGEWMRSRRAWNSWAAPAAVIGGTAAATQVFQMAVFAGFSQEGQFLTATGADDMTGALAGVPRLVRRFLAKDLARLLNDDQAMLVFCLLVVVALVVCWRRVEAHLCFGALAGGLIYNIANGSSTTLRYFQPGWICWVLVVAALFGVAAGVRPDRSALSLPWPRRAVSAGGGRRDSGG
jgi:putative flippase GtrA